MRALLDRHPRALPLLCAALLASLTLPLPFILDDWFHLFAVEQWRGLPDPQRPPYFDQFRDLGFLNLFHFFSGDPELSQAFLRDGPYPWWAAPELRTVFFRPLASGLAVLDHRLFGRAPLGWHLHSVLWYLALVAAVGVLYRKLLEPRSAALALLLFAIDDDHLLSTAWIAARNSQIAACFGVLGLLAHLRWREGWRWGLPLSLLGLALGLTGGEGALGLFALVGARQLLGPEPSLRARVGGLLPALILGLAWAVFYVGMDFGAAHSGMYLDPVHAPLRFAGEALQRIPVLVAGLFVGPVSDLWLFEPRTRPLLIGLGLLVLAGLWRFLRRAELGDRRALLRWWLPGGLLALLPMVATPPSSRNLLVPGLVAAVLIAWMLEQGSTWLRRGLAAAHLALPPLVWVGGAVAILHAQQRYERVMDSPAIADAVRASEAVFLPSLGDPMIGVYLQLALPLTGRAAPRRWHLAQLGGGPLRLTRAGPLELDLEPVDGVLLQAPFERLFGPAELDVGATVDVGDFTVEVLDAAEAGPTRLRFRFVRPLPLLVYVPDRLERVEWPAPGETLLLEPQRGPLGL